LTCFSGGNFILGGVALEEARYVEYGLELAQGCRQIYQTATRLGPNEWAWLDPRIINSSGQVRPVPEDQSGFYDRNGFFITGQVSAIGAEAVESWYYAYLATEDWLWLDYV
jgi:mannosyl-oligosaccharide alpha-1,2-mannosidase